MKRAKGLRAIVGGGLCALGILLVLSMPREERHTFRVNANGCWLVTDIVEPAGGGAPQGYVLLLPGLAANKRTMSYWTEGFASQGLRVFVPDLPGHGRSVGPFSFERADQCSANLLHELVGRGLLDPEKTILAGHSMGGAIALRVASREEVAGVVAISPAPLRPMKGLPIETMPFREFGKMPPHALVMSGSWEPHQSNDVAKELVPPDGNATDKYVLIPRASHVSILFDGEALAEAQNWAAGILHFGRRPVLPSHRGIYGFLFGLAGILALTGPFLREILEDKKRTEPVSETPLAARPSTGGVFLEYAVLSLGAVGVLHYAIPLHVIRLFEGDYFASLLLILGVVLLALNRNLLRRAFVRRQSETAPASRAWYVAPLVAAFAALLLCVLFGAWIDLGFTEAWPNAGRMARFLPFLLAVLPYHLAEELLLGAANSRKRIPRIVEALALRLVVWVAIVAAIFFLHSGQIMPVVLVTSFGLFCLGQRWAMDVVREVTSSPEAAAVFGAILLAGFCLVVFPTT
jgi:pimeloyl-ACP methyl ester carboxylesterase